MTLTNKPIIIIGTGLAGYSLAKEIRKIDTQIPLVLITHDDGHFYSKPQLSTAISVAKSPQQLVITDVTCMRVQLNAAIYANTWVRSIDIEAKSLIIEHALGEDELQYSKLVFAVGATPKPFPLLNQVEHNYRINSLQEYAKFIQNFQNKDHLTIIGSGLVGCEFAYDFANKVKQISVVTPDPHPLYQLVPAPLGEALQSYLHNLGIKWHTHSHIASVENASLLLSSGHQLQPDAILTAIGLRPSIALAKSANMRTNQGIVVDKYLQSEHENIFAIGDCAEIEGVCRQYVAPILHSARLLAQTICGKPTAIVFPPMPISLKVARYPIIVYPPQQSCGEWTFNHYPDGIKALFHDNNGHLIGYALSGSQLEHRQQCLKEVSQITAQA